MFNTDQSEPIDQHDCLHYYRVNDDYFYLRDPTMAVNAYQIIQYCIRPDKEELLSVTEPLVPHKTSVAFTQLNLQKITSRELLTWSAPIDLVERYQHYLDNQLTDSGNQTFYNCSSSWIGPFCQYTFDLENGVDRSFADIVRSTFIAKKLLIDDNYNEQPTTVTNLTCYTHIICDRGPTPLCLDWREICDGKVDCLNDAVDEENCFELELNECNLGEYRCHNGMCIAEEFMRDDPLNPECLDKTDEGSDIQYFAKPCYQDPGFRCEEHVCYHPKHEFACGDGQCDWRDTALLSSSQSCFNGRQWLMLKGTLMIDDGNSKCRAALMCLLNIIGALTVHCTTVCAKPARCALIVKDICPQPYFVFPSYPMFFGHVYFVFNTSSGDYSNHRAPEYVCYDAHVCSFIPWTIRINNFTCVHFRELYPPRPIDKWSNVTLAVRKIFATCGHCPNSSSDFFQCRNSTKCVSPHRLLDGVIDCVNESDEKFENSCTLQNSHHRFECPLESKRQCISPVLLHDGIAHCSAPGLDEITSTERQAQQRIPFTTLCDGFMELSEDEQNETDESNCELWQCNNLYTHCDGIWNCADGADELGCFLSPCNSNEHPCLSEQKNELICLPLIRTNDGIVDCRGGVDEREYCRRLHRDPVQRYLCQNDTQCEHIYTYSQYHPECRFLDIGWNFSEYRDSSGTIRSMCSPDVADQLTIIEKQICSLDDSRKPKIVHFSLLNNHEKQRKNVILEQSPRILITQNTRTDFIRAWSCNRGIFIRTRESQKCMCPPSYYGNKCQYQNQRVSLTLTFRTQEPRNMFNFVITLIDELQNIQSHDQVMYVAARDCSAKFNLYLLYGRRPKDVKKNYSVRIDAFEKRTLMYRTSWLIPVRFSFLPVNRMSALLTISAPRMDRCSLICNHGSCVTSATTSEQFCRCDANWIGPQCTIEVRCTCSPQSLCIGSVNNRSICVCPLGKYGPRCFLTHSSCYPNPCKHNGQCIPADERISEDNFTCLCPEGFSGLTCQNEDSRIDISFSEIAIPTTLIVHFITVRSNADPLHTRTLKTIPIDRNTVTLYMSNAFHLVFSQIQTNYYLLLLQSNYTTSAYFHTTVSPTRRCAHIHEVLNSTLLAHSLRRRAKYYHLPCGEQHELLCFFDEIFMCLCTDQRHANCFEFDHNMTYDCEKSNYCQNGAQCLQDHPSCPTTLMCACTECFYGTRCQLTTKGFGLSLDAILGYHISSHLSIFQQSIVVKASITITTIMFTVSLVGNTLSLLTFRQKQIRETGCGFYLFVSSINSLLTMTTFLVKFWLLILSQMNVIINRSVLQINCIWIEFLFKFFPPLGDWLAACVAVERVVAVHVGVNFSKNKSRRAATWVIIILVLFIAATVVHDPLHRSLIDDTEEQRTWCVTTYSSNIQIFDSVVNILHFFAPFSVNFVSALIIIFKAAHHRSGARKQLTRQQHLRQQLHELKHLLISPCVLVILALPRLVISFVGNCMKSARNPWLFLAGYFLSFVPSSLIFIIFVLPSQMYKEEFNLSIKSALHRRGRN